ncbi:hypothetical protein A6043_06465 [[Haemophilus] ducreyi]|uniref:hypothetical protein n=1 Tax=Haemophilus ducreyi TaxID=730 RepID=UPI0007CDD6AF|nr:hypothetical protein [[Haemophilus] ducreyi]ANF70969.1 hypothetical protein A6043_06465 [[Haemophilus] ducreyi]ANF71848.1 hypothetical protein A6044_02645 [[Haemophilus] ducreyi]
MCQEQHFFEIGQVCISRQIKNKLSDFAIANLLAYQQQGKCDEHIVAPHPDAAAIWSHYDSPEGEVIVYTDRTSENNLTTLYFKDEAEIEQRGYFNWSLDDAKPPFMLGQVTVTQAVSEVLSADKIDYLIRRQLNYDWGEVCQADWLLNDKAVTHHGRVVSLHTIDNESILVITEADRRSTTIMLSYEY